MRILIADDHEVVRKGVRSLLESQDDQNITEASNGREAVDIASEMSPDLVVLDVTMPILDGLSAAKQIKKALPRVPIVILSIHNGPEMMRATQRAGADAFVTKSDLGSVLLKAVEAVMQGKTYFSESLG
ncbi:MAG TPA: response regulator transcription factor [Candidatus Acidoferrum sp.]